MKPEKTFYRLIQGDCLQVVSKLEPESVNLVVVDPPYNIGIADWDKVKHYVHWLLARIKEFERVLKKNGVLWLFHSSFPTLAKIHSAIENETCFRFKQFITINKGLQSIAGRCSENLRSFPRATEYVVMYTFEDRTGAERLGSEYSKINPMASYLKSEFKRARITNKEIARLFPSKSGGMTGCVSNWLLGLNFPLKQQYERIREYLNGNNRGEFLKREYEDLRYPFNLPMGITDVWDINFYETTIQGHCTAKPVALLKLIISSSSTENGIVLDPFAGSGATFEACQILGRSCIGIEKNPKYCNLSRKRCFGRQFLDREAYYSFEVFQND